MRTTLDVDRELLEEIEKLTREKSPSKAVSKALREYIRRQKVEELIALAGKVDLIDNWRELEERELEEMAKTQW